MPPCVRPIEHEPLRVSDQVFHPVIRLPKNYDVYDFTTGYDPERHRQHTYGVGRYDEHRPGMYVGEQYDTTRRDVHVGIDIAAPVGDTIFAFYEGQIFKLGINPLPLDYGPTLITVHEWLGQTVYALYGHLSMKSLDAWSEGDTFKTGTPLAEVGSKEENGGWNPHVHFQLSLVRPETHDLPGVVSMSERAWARHAFPDPQLVLGRLY